MLKVAVRISDQIAALMCCAFQFMPAVLLPAIVT